MCGPAERGGVEKGELHATKGPPSTLHAKVEPGSFELNSKVAVVSVVEPGGPELIAATGGVVSAPSV